MQIAIAREKEKKVDLWCNGIAEDTDGTVHFNVINGLWDGKIKDGLLTVKYTGTTFRAKIVWRGTVPPLFTSSMNWGGKDYNGAIAWLNEELSKTPWQVFCQRCNVWDAVLSLREYEIKLVKRKKPAKQRAVAVDDDIPF